nr:FHA domain-containing protein [Chloroflexaceae bacterium]
ADGDEIALGTVQLRFTAPNLPPTQAHTVLMATVAEGRLTLLDGAETTVWQLDQLNTSLGRSKKNDVVLDNGTVSRHHADICFDGVSYFLVDAGASNGTWVDETRVFGSTRLRHGQVIRLGAQRLRFEHEEISYA